MFVVNICQLEILFSSSVLRDKIKNFALSTTIDGKEILIGHVDLSTHTFILNRQFIDVDKVTLRDKKMEIIYEYRSHLVDALMRAGLLKPDLRKYIGGISQWDDVIFGLDTNLFYSGVITASLLDELFKIPSGNYIDSPDWITLVLSKVAMGEIENKANHARSSLDRRQSLRAIQEIMLINKSKDLEGISLFLTGSIPPEIDFSTGEANTIRDSTIREHFRVFLKNLDFHKGSYFITEDFNNAVLAEAEGLLAMYVRKPQLEKEKYELHGESRVSISELLYELSITFLPLFIESDDITLKIESNWTGKTLEDWESWKIRLNWIEDQFGSKQKFEDCLKEEVPNKMALAWENLKERYVKWLL